MTTTKNVGEPFTFSAAHTDPGAGHTIEEYKWTVDDVIQSQKTDFLIISPDVGSHRVSLEIKNDCGSWSNLVYASIDVIYVCPKPVLTGITVT